MTTRTMTMGMTQDGGDRGIAPPKPLFESSWLALFVLLRQELESLRDEAEDGEIEANVASEPSSKGSPGQHN